jgi:2,3,4,5-tetrahydropyridine-2,6-dicarboxylate N-succinyltransferase
MPDLESRINTLYEQRAEISPHTADKLAKAAVHDALKRLNRGELRVAEKVNGQWIVHEWLKKAILLSFKMEDNQLFEEGYSQFYDKVPLKFAHLTHAEFHEAGVRVVPPATARFGSFIAPNCVLMPCFVNIGAYIDTGTMIDTWATVGSCAQIGKNVHISGGTGIGGVLEPAQAAPTIIEDNVFIGARSEIAEGVIIEEGAVIAMGTFISQSTKIYDRENDIIIKGRVPTNAVVVPGSIPSPCGKYALSAAIIVKRVDEQTRQKTGINAILREFA